MVFVARYKSLQVLFKRFIAFRDLARFFGLVKFCLILIGRESGFLYFCNFCFCFFFMFIYWLAWIVYFILLDFDSTLLFFGYFYYFPRLLLRIFATKFSYPKSYKFMLKLPFCLRAMATKAALSKSSQT